MGPDDLAALRKRLALEGFDAPVSGESVFVCRDLLNSLVAERNKSASMSELLRESDRELWLKEQEGPALRTEVGRLVRENNRLHAELISSAEQIAAMRRGEGEEISRARGEVRDLAFLCASLRHVASCV